MHYLHCSIQKKQYLQCWNDIFNWKNQLAYGPSHYLLGYAVLEVSVAKIQLILRFGKSLGNTEDTLGLAKQYCQDTMKVLSSWFLVNI